MKMHEAGFRQLPRDSVEFTGTRLFQCEYDHAEESVSIKVDLLCARSPYSQGAIDRSIPLDEHVLGFPIRVLCCEDLILFKLIAGRIIDLADAAELLRANKSQLNEELLTRLANESGMAEPLRKLQAEADS